ncbi:MAG: hypothetical protein WAM04_09985 [Candidatus Sulfotelmatobacter sp.]
MAAVKPATRERCALCGRPINPDEDDALQVNAGFVHQSCLEQYDGEDAIILEREQMRECSVAEIQRQRRQARRKAG